MKVAVILPAAGMGTRMGKGAAEKTGTSRKQFMLLEGSPILMHTVRRFCASDRVGVIVVAVRAEDVMWVLELLAGEFPGHRVRVVEGGNSRQESVENALRTLGPEYELVAVHDAVRPFIDLETSRFVPNTAVLPDAYALKKVTPDQFAAAVLPAIEPLSLRDAFAKLKRGRSGLPIYEAMYLSDDFLEGPRAFAEKRKPVWKGR